MGAESIHNERFSGLELFPVRLWTFQRDARPHRPALAPRRSVTEHSHHMSPDETLPIRSHGVVGVDAFKDLHQLPFKIEDVRPFHAAVVRFCHRRRLLVTLAMAVTDRSVRDRL